MASPIPQVTETGPGRYEAFLDESWNLRPLPQGGIVTAVAVRAMEAALADPGQGLRGLHTTFVAQVAAGPLEVDVDVLRRGRSMSHLRAEVRGADTERGHVTTAVFGGTRRGFEFSDLEPPAPIIPPGQCRSFRDPLPPEAGEFAFEPMPFWDRRVEGRGMIGHAPWDPYVPDRAEHATWYRMDDPPWQDDGRLDPTALIVFADTMPGAVAEKVGNDQRQQWFGPSVDFTFHLLDDCRSEWVLAHNRARHAGDGYASVDMALWDCGEQGEGRPRLVAYATQIMFFAFGA